MKEIVGAAAVDALVRDGMKLGLGSGSTAVIAVRRVGALLAAGALKDIRAVATSFQTELECEKLGIPLFSLNSAEIDGALDLTIDGADEIDNSRFCVKGGGGALLLEKIVAYASSSYAIVADETKLVARLGQNFPVAVEVVPDARVSVFRALEALGGSPVLRAAIRKAGPVVTDRGNLLLDVTFKDGADDPASLEDTINHIPGVVENGFFTKLRPRVFIGRAAGIVDVWE